LKSAMKQICQSSLSRNSRIVRAFLGGGIFLGLLVLYLVPPAHLPLPACAFHSLTGHSCLTCGMTRSLHAMSQGELAVSLRYHLFGPVLFFGALLFAMLFAAEAVTAKQFSLQLSGRTKKYAAMLFSIVWIVYWGARLFAEIKQG
jgi:hypothetical protein